MIRGDWTATRAGTKRGSSTMRAVDVIRKKRDGQALTAEEIRWMVDHVPDSGEPTLGSPVTPYHWSALLMAIVWRGMDADETRALTDAMMRSGSVVDLSAIPGPKVDKHSTGGVGDKTSLILAPVAAAAGLVVPMVSGRALGHTGGTLDKLESIPGFNVDLDLDRYRSALASLGLVMIGQTADIAPADRFLYALRDATATVESVPLIAASIMSKKLAEGIDGLVLDVKTGDGAFLERIEDSRALAETMGRIGRALGKRVVALITSMEQPLGRAVGNAVEVAESIGCLAGRGRSDDLLDLSIELAAEMVLLGGGAATIDEARRTCRRTIEDGSALERFRGLIEAQGGDPRVIDEPSRLPRARRVVPLKAGGSGYVAALRARPIGHATMLLGAGRVRVDSAIDPAVGIVFEKKVGDPVARGDVLCKLLVNDRSRLDEVRAIVEGAYTIADEPPEPAPLIVERIGSDRPPSTAVQSSREPLA
jgi:pyrimidine-nucleoside phosphorylase/thymidine phosphorylase